MYRRPDRYGRPGIFARPVARRAQRKCRVISGAGAVVDVDLHADGGDSRRAAGRFVPGGQPMMASIDGPVDAAPRLSLSPRLVVTAVLLAVLALLPLYAKLTGDSFVL